MGIGTPVAIEEIERCLSLVNGSRRQMKQKGKGGRECHFLSSPRYTRVNTHFLAWHQFYGAQKEGCVSNLVFRHGDGRKYEQEGASVAKA